MKYKKLKKNKGFVILFAVTLSAILLSIALGVANIALREIKFGTSAKDTNEAFFAADTGIEQMFYNDLKLKSYTSPMSLTTFTFPGLGSNNQSCAIVSITKTGTSPSISTSLVSKGYNNGTCTPGPNTVERELDSNY